MLAVILGAFGAHMLKATLPYEQLDSYETAVRYQIYHALSIFVLVILRKQIDVTIDITLWCFAIGMLLFSGSIYVLATIPVHGYGLLRMLGPVTPIGGALFIVGWLNLAVTMLRRR